MKGLLSFEDLEKELKNSFLPAIDIKSSVMNKIKYNIKSRYFNRAAVLTTVISVMLIITTLGVYAAINGWQLKNNKGEVVYSLKKMTEDQSIEWNQGTVEWQRLWNLVDNGEAVLIGDLKSPEFTLHYIIKPEEILDISAAKELAGEDVKNLIKIPEDYKFRCAQIIYDYREPDKITRERAIEKAVKNGERYVKIPLIKSDIIDSIVIDFYKQVEEYRIEVFKECHPQVNGPLEGYIYDPENNIEKLVAGDKEVLFRKMNRSQEISWVDIIDGKVVHYRIRGSKDIPREKLINSVNEMYK